ncbi:MAG: hypothetical protein HY904_19500 [Deltaproteobacteria bacterium]|nr:hypothetical protein [Deltaproteobacteria bacterium]
MTARVHPADNLTMRWKLLVGVPVCAALLALGSCYGAYGQGEACDPTLGGRDCADTLVCAYDYDECPQYGCPKCRLQCRTNADCESANADRCDAARECKLQQRTDYSGVCGVCDDIKPIWPP